MKPVQRVASTCPECKHPISAMSVRALAKARRAHIKYKSALVEAGIPLGPAVHAVSLKVGP